MPEVADEISELIDALEAAEADVARGQTRAERASAEQVLTARRYHAAPKLVAALRSRGVAAGRNATDPTEVVARALCRFAGNPENTRFEGKPMWQSYSVEATAVIEALRKNGT